MKKLNQYAVCMIAAALVLLGVQSALWAHAFLDHATPSVGSKVSEAPSEVKIWYTQQIEPAFSKIEVDDADGKQVDKEDSHVDDKDHSLLIVSLEKLPPGVYSVHWHVVSVDTHKTQGDFKFTITK